ncbi:MAG: class I SAM-dependent methyltransferase, partial [Gemmatimonadota bacterium]|nr:class I SAM-dependent methyltransferase [Gemmatimonadota bacterium]
TRSFIRLRWWLTPYRKIAGVLPTSGRVLDLGSGHGLLSLALSMESERREIIGIDHDQARVRLAERAASRHESFCKPRFEVGDLETALSTFGPGSLSGIAMIDILHYLAADSQAAVLHEAARVLEPDGILAVREVDPEGGMAGVWNRFYENVATRIGFTQSARTQLEFRSVAGWTSVLESAGFEVRSQPCGSPLFSDVLFVARRPV